MPFPDDIFEGRETENLNGIVYDPTDKKNLFSEDIQAIFAEITEIETLFQVFAQKFSVVDDPSFGTLVNFSNSLSSYAGEISFQALPNDNHYSIVQFLGNDYNDRIGFIFRDVPDSTGLSVACVTFFDTNIGQRALQFLTNDAHVGGGIPINFQYLGGNLNFIPNGGGNVGIGQYASSTSILAVSGFPTDSSGLSAGDVWCDTTGGLNILKVV